MYLFIAQLLIKYCIYYFKYLMNLSILIISYKSITKLEKCLSTIGNDKEIIIVENSNNIEIKEIIERKYKNCKVIINNDNLGWSKAANIGLKEIKTQYVILLNPDTLIKSNQFLEIENEIKNCKEDFTLATPFYDELIDFNNNKDFDKDLNITKLNIEKESRKTKVDMVKGSALIINLNKFENRKIYDENLFFFFEEVDLCKRVKKMNGDIYIFNKIKIIHDGGGSVDDVMSGNYGDFRNWNYYWSRFYYNKKHYGYLSSFIMHFSKLIRFFISAIIFFFLSKSKFRMNKSRFFGLFSSMTGVKSSTSKKILNKN